MATTASVTLEQFLEMEETKPYSECAGGEVTQKPMPNVPHSAIQVFLAAMLFRFLDGTGIGQVFTELRCIFGPSDRERAYVPDLSYVSRERRPTDLFLRTAPDLAIEILSPDQDMGRFLDKIQFLLAHGARLVWVLDPVRRTVAILAPGQDARILTPGDTLDGGEVLPGLAISVAAIFASTDLA
jgi:Uma2 family endonuclease